MKKDSGRMMEQYSILLTCILICAVLLCFSGLMAGLEKKSKLDTVARKYLLIMETQGYLKGEKEVQLLEELEEVGAKNISLMGTTTASVGYGEEIVLHIQGQIPVISYEGEGFLWRQTVQDEPFVIEKSSTAKH